MKKIYFFAILCFIIAACKKENPVQYDPFPIKGTVKNSALGNEISWNMVQSNDFVSYRLWQSTKADTINEKDLSNTAFQLSNITDNEKTNFVTAFNFSFNQFSNVNYRIQLVLKDRTLWSRNIKVVYKQPIKYNKQVDRVFTDGNNIYMFSNDDGSIQIFDSATEAITSNKFISSALSFSDFSYCFGTFNGLRELYLSAKNDLFIFDANTLELKYKLPFAESLKSVTSNEKGLIYIQANDTNHNILVFERSTNTVINKISQAFASILLYLPLQNRILTVKEDYPQPAHFLGLSADGKSLASSTAFVDLNIQKIALSGSTFAVAFKQEELFILGINPTYFDKNLKFKGAFNTASNGTLTFGNYYYNQVDDLTYGVRFNDKTLSILTNIGAVSGIKFFTHNPFRIAFAGDKKWAFTYLQVFSFGGETQIEKMDF